MLMTVKMLQDLLIKNKQDQQAQQNLLRMYELLTGHKFSTVDAALNA